MAVDLTATYTVTAPTGMDGRGAIAIVNGDPTAGNFVGYLVDSSGFDSPEVREGGVEDNVESDGGTHGSFYYGRRPFTMEIAVAAAATNTLSMERLDKLYRATNAMRGDGTITWTEAGVAKILYFRRQLPVRGPSAENRCLFAGVSADPRIYSGGSETTAAAATSLSLTNAGNVGTLPRFTVASPSATCVFTNTTTGEVLTITGLDGSGTLTVDFKNRTVTRGGVNKYGKVSFPSSVWWELVPGVNSVTVTNAATPFFRSAWI